MTGLFVDNNICKLAIDRTDALITLRVQQSKLFNGFIIRCEFMYFGTINLKNLHLAQFAQKCLHSLLFGLI
jgi:hypothetical protein